MCILSPSQLSQIVDTEPINIFEIMRKKFNNMCSDVSNPSGSPLMCTRLQKCGKHPARLSTMSSRPATENPVYNEGGHRGDLGG